MGNNKLIKGNLITKRTDFYYMVINAGYTEDGKRNRLELTTGIPQKGNNKRKAETMLNETIRNLEECRKITGKTILKELHSLITTVGLETLRNKPQASTAGEENPLFTEVAHKWLENKQAHTSEGNCAKYVHAMKRIDSYFASIRIKELSTYDIDRYYTLMQKGDTSKGIKSIGTRTLVDHKALINGSIEYAMRVLKVITDNPSIGAYSPTKKPRIPRYFKDEQLNAVLDKIQGNPLEPAVVLAINYGLRKSEILGLRWSAIDFNSMTLTVERTVTQVESKQIDAPKTKNLSSFRTFPLTTEIAAYLKALKQEQQENKKLCGNAYTNNDYVCKWADGHPFLPNTVYDKWTNFLKANDFPHISFHDLRHSSASLLVRLGFTLLEIQLWLGHADIKSTLIYAHLDDDEAKQRVAEKINVKLNIPNKSNDYQSSKSAS